MTLPMPVAPGADARSFPLIDALFARHRFAEVDSANLEAFVRATRHALLVFTEHPGRCRETLDLAVIVPEIVDAFPGRFAVGVVLPEAARALQPRYGFRRWPALVMLRDGEYLDAVDGLRNWDEYLAATARFLDAGGSDAPATTAGAPEQRWTP
jgi:hydrogenase-1 operon protein HyaE